MEQNSGVRKIFLLLFAVNFLNYVDRQVLYAVFPLIKTDLRLSDAQLGTLGSAFIIVYMLYAPIAGFFGDRSRRQRWMGVSAVIWSVATACCARVRGYGQLLFARAAVGVGEAGFTALAPSFLAEKYPPERRARILSYFTAAMPLGSAAGYLLGGFLGEKYGWRNAFLIVGAPGVLLGVLVFFLKDGNTPGAAKKTAPAFREYKALFANPVYLLVSLSQAAATFAVGGLAAWMPTYFHRYLGFSVAKAGIVFGGITVIAGTLGTLAGGAWADALLKKTKKAYFQVAARGFIWSVPFGLAAVIVSGPWAAAAFFFAAEFCVFLHCGPLNAAIVGSTPLEIRSMAFAANMFIIHIFGDATSPAAIGLASDIWGLRIAVAACMLILSVAAAFALLAGRAAEKL